MIHFRDQEGKIYAIEKEDEQYLLPPGCSMIPDGEWQEMQRPTLVQIAAEMKAAVQLEKVRVRDAGMTVNGIFWDTDPAAISAYMQFYIQLLTDQSYTVQKWKASDGVWVVMDAATLASIMPAWESLQSSVFSWQAAKEAEIDAAVSAGDAELLSSVSVSFE